MLSRSRCLHSVRLRASAGSLPTWHGGAWPQAKPGLHNRHHMFFTTQCSTGALTPCQHWNLCGRLLRQTITCSPDKLWRNKLLWPAALCYTACFELTPNPRPGAVCNVTFAAPQLLPPPVVHSAPISSRLTASITVHQYACYCCCCCWLQPSLHGPSAAAPAAPKAGPQHILLYP